MKRFNEEVYTGSPKVNLSCFREFDELERCLRYSDLKTFVMRWSSTKNLRSLIDFSGVGAGEEQKKYMYSRCYSKKVD